MKTRTWVVAWIFLIWSAFLCLVFVNTIVSHHWVPYRMLWYAIQWPLWIALLKRGVWAWWPLVAMYALAALTGLVTIIRTPGDYLAHPNVTTSLARLLAVYIGYFAIFVGLPLWILLTDPPSGWTNPQSVPPEAGNEER